MKQKQILVVTDFLFRPDKKLIMESLDCNEHNPAYAEMMKIYDQMAALAASAMRIKAAYVLDQKLSGVNPSGAIECDQLIYCLMTIGKPIADKSAVLFQAGQYTEGLVLDAIANYVLFDCSRQLYQKIVCEAQASGLGLTRRLTPGEGDFDVTCQQSILERFAAEDALGITMTEGCMLDPIKSLAYVYGVDAALSCDPVDHDCTDCGKLDCKLRKLHQQEKTVILSVIDGDRRILVSAKTSESIMNALSTGGIRIHSPCGGRGTCGKCKIKITSGMVTQAGLVGEGIYLACLTFPLTNCEIDIRPSQEPSYHTVVDFSASAYTPSSGFRLVDVKLTAADWRTGDSVIKRVNHQLEKEYSYSLKVLRKLSLLRSGAKGETAQITLLAQGDKLIDLLPERASRVFGLAIDIGTTTLVISLVDLLSGEVVKTYSLLNGQRRYGADVISRIQYSTGDNGADLHASICADIVSCVRDLTAEIRALIVHVAIAGNTTMLHFLQGLSAESLGRYPFQPVTTEFQQYTFSELFGDTSLDCLTSILPGVSAFVGADVVAGMLQCGFANSSEVAILIDIGTNGEIVIGNRGRMLCLATAAGPAFEGANISCGTGSISGAIASFHFSDGQPRYTTIDSAAPVGICGSGVIDIMAACIRERMVNAAGKLDQQRFPNGAVPVAQTAQGNWIHFSQKDIRELQLAKAAIRAGAEVLLEAYGCHYDQVHAVYLAGSFGSHVNIDSAVTIGLLPKELQAKVKTVGNSSLGGTIRFLLDQSSQHTIYGLLAVSNHLDLAADPRFNEIFIEQMMFPSTE